MRGRIATAAVAAGLVLGGVSHVLAEGEAPKGMLACLDPEANESHLYSVTFAPDGKTIVTVLGKKVHVWDASTYKELRQFSMKEDERRLAMAPDGKSFAWVTGDQVSLVDFENGEPKSTLETKPDYGSVSAVAWKQDGKELVGAGDVKGNPAIWIWDVATGNHKLVKGPDVPDNYYTLALSPDGKIAAAGMNRSGEIRLVDLEAGKELKKLAVGDHLPKRIVFSPDGKLLATVGFQEPVRVFDVEKGSVIFKLSDMGYAVCVAFSPDGKLLAASDREQFCIWSVETRKRIVVQTRKGPLTEVHDTQGTANGPEEGLVFSPDGKRIAWGCEYEEWAHVRVWDVAAITEKK